jgi:hypothetical protein
MSPAPLPTLRKKRERRKAGRRRQLKLFRCTKKPGHRKQAGIHGRAARFLSRLIARLRREQKVDWNGCEPLTHPPLVKAARLALTTPGLYITSTTGGTHSATSWHYKARAFDGGSDSGNEGPEIEAQNRLLAKFGAGYFAELFGPDDWYVSNGVKYSGTFPNHHDHLHVAVI